GAGTGGRVGADDGAGGGARRARAVALGPQGCALRVAEGCELSAGCEPEPGEVHGACCVLEQHRDADGVTGVDAGCAHAVPLEEDSAAAVRREAGGEASAEVVARLVWEVRDPV